MLSGCIKHVSLTSTGDVGLWHSIYSIDDLHLPYHPITTLSRNFEIGDWELPKLLIKD